MKKQLNNKESKTNQQFLSQQETERVSKKFSGPNFK